MTPETATTYLAALDGTVPVETWGEVAFFYNPGQQLKRGTYFATIKAKDGENDRASALDRDGVWRLNVGIPPALFETRFGPRPARPVKGGVVTGPWDFTALDQLMPHPVYGWMGWIAVNNPSAQTFEACLPLIKAAHKKAATAFAKRVRSEKKNKT